MQAPAPADDPMKLMIAVSQSRWSGYPEASFSSRGAFEWTLNKIIGSNTSEFKFLIVHVQPPVSYKNADGTAEVRWLESNDMGRIFTSPNDFNDLKCPDLLRGVHLLEFFVKRCHDKKIACEAWINMGSPNVVIPVEVQRVKPDLLLLGNRDIPRHMKPTVESVSDCARRVHCPVLIVKRSAEFANLGFDPVAD